MYIREDGQTYRYLANNRNFESYIKIVKVDAETGTGVYEMPDMCYGGYFVKETKAPEGFYLDEHACYFEITEHGKTVTMENEAGKGFINAAQVASLKIIKTSFDNKVADFKPSL